MAEAPVLEVPPYLPLVHGTLVWSVPVPVSFPGEVRIRPLPAEMYQAANRLPWAWQPPPLWMHGSREPAAGPKTVDTLPLVHVPQEPAPALEVEELLERAAVTEVEPRAAESETQWPVALPVPLPAEMYLAANRLPRAWQPPPLAPSSSNCSLGHSERVPSASEQSLASDDVRTGVGTDADADADTSDLCQETCTDADAEVDTQDLSGTLLGMEEVSDGEFDEERFLSRSPLLDLPGRWRDKGGSLYEVILDGAKSCSVRTTRPRGRVRVTRALIRCDGGTVTWGHGFVLTPTERPNTIRWASSRGGKDFVWQRVDGNGREGWRPVKTTASASSSKSRVWRAVPK